MLVDKTYTRHLSKMNMMAWEIFMTNYSEWFAGRLRETMGSMTQAELLKILAENGCQIAQPRLSHYMQGRNYPDPPILAHLARALEVSADYLLGLTEETATVAELAETIAIAKGEGRINGLFNKLSKDEREQVSAFAEYLLARTGRADEIARSNEAGFEAALTVFQRKHGAEATDDLLDVLQDNFPELGKLVSPTPSPKRRRINKS